MSLISEAIIILVRVSVFRVLFPEDTSESLKLYFLPLSYHHNNQPTINKICNVQLLVSLLHRLHGPAETDLGWSIHLTSTALVN